MAHELEQFSDGTAAFFSARQDAWHQLGTVTTTCLKAEQVMDVAYLGGWLVEKEALRTIESGALVPDKWATTRRHPKTGTREVLGLVGSTYQIMQNEALCQVLDMIVGESGAHFETAGSLRGGREVFVTMKLPDTMRIAGIDAMDLYLAVLNSHDGSRAARLLCTPVRIVCANTQAAALANNVGEYVIQHSGNIVAKLAQARDALRLVPTYLDQFQAAAEQMIDRQLEWDRLARIAAELWPLGDEDPETAYLRKMTRERELRYLFEEAPTQAAIRGTAWAGLQALIEWLDHLQPAKSDIHRAHRVLTEGKITTLKQRAFDLVLAA